jgi:hypothetical protein
MGRERFSPRRWKPTWQLCSIGCAAGCTAVSRCVVSMIHASIGPERSIHGNTISRTLPNTSASDQAPYNGAMTDAAPPFALVP